MKKMAWLTIVIFLASLILIGTVWNQNHQLENELTALKSETAIEAEQQKTNYESAISLLQNELAAAEEDARNDAVLYEAALADTYAQIEKLQQEISGMIPAAQHETEMAEAENAAAAPLLEQIDSLNLQIYELQSKCELLSASLTAKEKDYATCLEQLQAIETQIAAMYTQSDLEAAIANATKDTAAPLSAQIKALEAQIEGMYTKEQVDTAVAAGKEEAAAPLLAQIQALHEQMAGMYAQSDLEAAIANATKDTAAPLNAQIKALEAQIEGMYTEDELNTAVETAKTEAEQPLLRELEAWAEKADAMVNDALAAVAQETQKAKEAFLASDIAQDLSRAKDQLSAALSCITSHSQIVSSLLPVAQWLIQQGLVEDIEIQITIQQGEVTQTLYYTGATLSSLNLDALNNTAYEMTITITDKDGNALTSYTFRHAPDFDVNAVG